MTARAHETAQQAAPLWQDAEFARAWAAGDKHSELLTFPRALTAALLAHDRPDTALVVDIASGPGAFLAVLLDEFPQARGVWSDFSEPMREQAVAALARFGDRVEFRLGDMTDLAGAGIPEGADVILTSRAAHHLDRDALGEFYRQAASRLAPGGWLVNLDHTGPSEAWAERYRAVRPRFYKPVRDTRKRHHDRPPAPVKDHLACLRAAGLHDVDIAWQAMHTVLFMARRDD